VTIGTVPVVTGFPVTLDGVTRLTDGNGQVEFDAPDREQALDDRITLTDATLPIGDQQVRVRADRLVRVGDDLRLALDLSYLVRFRFAGSDGSPVDSSSIATITVKSSTGEVVELPADQGSWLQGSRVTRIGSDLQVKELGWSVQRVEYTGSNVVNASQQRFLPAHLQDVAVQLLSFGARLNVHDALFGFSYGSAVELVYPDGKSRRLPLDAGQLSLPALPRGDYTITVLGGGPRMSRPLTVSRDQDLELAFYSWLDVVAVVGVVGALAVGLGWGGRVRRRQTTADATDPDGDEKARHAAHAAAGQGDWLTAAPLQVRPPVRAVADDRHPA
jgi:hypothetical protein